jgi:hypothetical protein
LLSQTFILKKLLDVPLKFADKKDISLLMEISKTCLSVVWYSNGPKKIWGTEVYDLPSGVAFEAELIALISTIRQHKLKPEKVNLYFDFPDFMLVPDELYKQGSEADMLDLFFGKEANVVCKTDQLKIAEVKNVYRISNSILNPISMAFPNAKLTHSNVKQINGKVEGDLLTGIVFNNIIKLFLYQNNELHLVKHFTFSTHDDVVYAVLQICSVHDIDPNQIKLRLKGMIVKDSALYQSLYNYFMDIDLEENVYGVQMTNGFSDIPKQYMSHLIELTL